MVLVVEMQGVEPWSNKLSKALSTRLVGDYCSLTRVHLQTFD